MSGKEWIYAALVALGVVAPWYFNLQVIGAGGNLLLDFFTVPFESAVNASLLVDLLIAFAAFNVFLITARDSVGRGGFWLCLGVSWCVAFAAGLPLFLLLRERAARAPQAV